MSSSTTTMTLSPHARLRVSESTPPFLIQQKHGPPPYFLYRTPVAAPHRGPSTPPLKQKRSFNIGSSNALEQSSTAPQAQLVDADTIYAPATIYTPETTPGGAEAPAPAKSRYRLSPPSPEKALPPIPFPSRSSSPVVDATGPARSLLLPTLPCVKAPRPTSQDKEETIRQLEQLAAELKRMGLGVLPEPGQRRAGGSYRRRLGGATLGKPAGSVSVPRPSLSVPRIVVTNASKENLGQDTEYGIPSVEPSDSDDGSGDVTEEELWVEAYGAWGTSEKGKWKASASEDDADADFHESDPSPDASLSRGRSIPAALPAEVFYIYEPIGAPEFLVGSSTSPIARATAGFHSCRPMVFLKPETQTHSIRRRRRRPTALVLATPEQAEWFVDVAPSSAPHLSRPPRTASHRALSIPLPSSARSLSGIPIPPSAHLTPRRALSSDAAADASSGSCSYDVSSSTSSHDVATTASALSRRSEPLVSMPRMLSASALRDEEGQGRQTASWTYSVPVATSEPNSPRHGVRPRLKSFKGLFKHFSK